MCTVLLPPGDNPIAVNKYIINNTHRTLAISGVIYDMDCELLYQKHFWHFLPAIRTTHHFRASHFAAVNPPKHRHKLAVQPAATAALYTYGEYPSPGVGDSHAKL